MSSNTSIHYPLKGKYVETPFRIDETLQTIQTGKSCMEEFEQKQGTLIVINLNNGTEKKFVVQPGDDVRISCSAGWCRSQTTYFIFEMFDGIINRNPHGARDYFDPITGKAQWDKNIQKENELDEFETCFGLKKAQRIGHKEFVDLRNSTNPSQETLAKIKEYYNKYYYGPESTDSHSKRIVYITFAANAHAILYRLNQTNNDLSRHTVVCLDLDDYITCPLQHWNTYPRSVVGYTNYAQLVMKFFDFSCLKPKEPSVNQKDPYERIKNILWCN